MSFFYNSHKFYFFFLSYSTLDSEWKKHSHVCLLSYFKGNASNISLLKIVSARIDSVTGKQTTSTILSKKKKKSLNIECSRSHLSLSNWKNLFHFQNPIHERGRKNQLLSLCKDLREVMLSPVLWLFHIYTYSSMDICAFKQYHPCLHSLTLIKGNPLSHQSLYTSLDEIFSLQISHNTTLLSYNLRI